MNYIFNKITDLPEKIQNEFLVDALFYRIHTSIEAVMDIVAMLCKDFGLIVEDGLLKYKLFRKTKHYIRRFS